LGATAPWLDPDGDFSRVGVHSFAEGLSVVQSAQALVTRVLELRAAGLSAKAAFLVLQAFSQGHVTHLLRSNYEASGWAREFDDTLIRGLEHLVGEAFSEDQRAQSFLRLSDGGLGFSSAEVAAEAAFLSSWALALKQVAESVGATSWEGFRSRCSPLAHSLARAEAKLLEASGGNLQPVDWVSLLAQPQAKLQSTLSAKLQEHRKRVLLTTLGQGDKVDLRSAGGPEAGGFLEAPVLFKEEGDKAMPDQHFLVALRDRLRLRVPSGGHLQASQAGWHPLR
jgi:hypothetical protein